MRKDSRRGAITVYLSIILSSVILLSGVLMDIVRIKAAEVQVRRAVNTAAASALAGYNTKLKEDYGLFALHDNNTDKLEETIASYLGKNLLVGMEKAGGSRRAYDFLKSIVVNDEYRDVHFINLYDYKIENVEVVPVYNFTENEITRQQMAEYMKYRAPAQFAENFMEKVDYVSSAGELTDAYKQKTVIDKKMAKVEKALTTLQKHLDDLNKFNKNKFENKQGGGSLVDTYIKFEVQKSVYKVYSSVNITAVEAETDKEKLEELQRDADELYDDASQNAKATMKQLEEHVNGCLEAAHKASKEITDIKAMVSSLKSDIEALKASLQEMEKDNKQDKPQLTAAMRQDIAKWEQLVDSENSSGIIGSLEKDILILNNIKDGLQQISHIIDIQSKALRSQVENDIRKAISEGGSLNMSGASEVNATVNKVLLSPELKHINNSAEGFEIIKSVLTKNSKKKGKDPRKTIADSAKEISKAVSSSNKTPKRIDKPELLPSYYINGSYPNKAFYEGDLKKAGSQDSEAYESGSFEVDFEEDSSFSEDTFGFITGFASKLEQYAKNMRDEIYINEYILKTFKDEVEVKDAGTDSKIRDTLFDRDEVEYILAGSPSETQNLLIIKGKILLIRFGMNTLHVYSDAEKRLKALEIATAAAGITGFGIPVVHNLIMCSWGMAESLEDMKDLYQGKPIPFIKTAETWRTDLMPGGYTIKKNVQKNGGMMDFDYHDYLRLLLLVQNKETKMNRIEDLIQLNMQKRSPEFKLSNYNTYVKVNVQVSMKYWFLTKIFVPSKLKTPDGRHRINIEAWKGY